MTPSFTPTPPVLQSQKKDGRCGPCAQNTNTTIQPTIGTNSRSCSQPLRLVSCRRRVVTAVPGSITTIVNAHPAALLKTSVARLPMTVKSMNHQNSAREAQPLKSANFVKQMRMESGKVTARTSRECYDGH